MILSINSDDAEAVHVDRDGVAHHYPQHSRQGFVIGIGGLTVAFNDEEDAAWIARMILRRLGELDEPR